MRNIKKKRCNHLRMAKYYFWIPIVKKENAEIKPMNFKIQISIEKIY
jgi:hypothetical protein